MPLDLTLYHYWRSSSSWRVRWVLALKGLSYKAIAINLLEGEQKKPPFLNINPNAQVPVLIADGKVLTESLAIIEWLEEVYPSPSIFPHDPWLKAKARELALVIAAGIQPLGNLKVLLHHSSDPMERESWHRYFIQAGLKTLEIQLTKFEGPFCLGQDLSLVDICLIPQIYNGLRFNVDMQAFPRALAIYNHCLSSPACDQAAPHNQVGAHR